MSQQGDEFVRRVLKADPDQANWTFGESLGHLQKRAGSLRGAARLIGVSDGSIRRWLAGTNPKAASQQKVFQAAREDRTFVSALGDAGTIVPMVTKERNRPDRERDVWGSQLDLEPGTTEAARREWVVTGSSDAALLRFVQGVREPWYRSQLARGIQYANGAAAGGGGGGDGRRRAAADDEEMADELEQLVDEEYVMESDYGVSIG